MAQWQDRLEQNFTVNGHVGGNLFEIFEQEKARGAFFATTFHGQSVLMDSFMSFFVETLKNARQWLASNGWPPNCPSYVYIYVYYVVMFRRFRACELLLLSGYPFDGYALLRGLKDLAVVLAGIAHNLTTLTKTWGATEGQTFTEENLYQVTNLRKQEENRIWSLLLRKKSGLPSEVSKELSIWERLFHEEVHGSKSSLGADVMRWLRGQGEPLIGPIVPSINDTSWSNYMNRAVEIGWLIVRLLPYLQPVENAFGEDWRRKQEILDDSFRVAEQSFSVKCKEIGEAFIGFVDAKFSFKKPFHYFEADGSETQTRGHSCQI
ncbi:MAG: hypothetical protein M1587_03865 [Thaumarchaeota archaeon]|nr:hypothetical protein [Nitrososphaerota archaeon]